MAPKFVSLELIGPPAGSAEAAVFILYPTLCQAALIKILRVAGMLFSVNNIQKKSQINCSNT